MLLSVDAHSWQCCKYPVPTAFKGLGGRGLAIALAAEGNYVASDGEPCLVLAPGLLAAYCREATARCAVVHCLPGRKGAAFSSAGGSAASALACCGLRAMLVHGIGNKGELCDIIVDASGGRVVPVTDTGHAALASTATVMADLSAQWPEAACIICTGHLGRLGVAIAGTTFSNAFLRPCSHAGGGTGMALGLAGVRAIVIDRVVQQRTTKYVDPIGRAFTQALQVCGSRTGLSCTMQCSTCSQGVSVSGGSGRKWPGFEKMWASGDEEADANIVARYAALCDDMQVDAFALAERLEDLVNQDLLPAGDANFVLAELDSLAQRPETSWLLPRLQGWMPTYHPKASQQRVLLDTLGLCRFAISALDDSRVRGLLEAMIAAETGEDVTTLDDWMERVLKLDSF